MEYMLIDGEDTPAEIKEPEDDVKIIDEDNSLESDSDEDEEDDEFDEDDDEDDDSEDEDITEVND